MSPLCIVAGWLSKAAKSKRSHPFSHEELSCGRRIKRYRVDGDMVADRGYLRLSLVLSGRSTAGGFQAISTRDGDGAREMRLGICCDEWELSRRWLGIDRGYHGR